MATTQTTDQASEDTARREDAKRVLNGALRRLDLARAEAAEHVMIVMRRELVQVGASDPNQQAAHLRVLALSETYKNLSAQYD